MSFFWGTLTVIGYLLTLLLIPLVLLTKKKHSSSTVAWIMVILAVPFVGGVLFLVFGINRVERHREPKHQAAIDIARTLPRLSQYHILPGETLNAQQRVLMKLGSRLTGSRPTVGNKIEVIAETHEAFAQIEEAVLSARESIHLEYYIWRADKIGTRLRDLLIRKAEEGLTVRFLYDGIGSWGLGRKFLDPMRRAGIHVTNFLPGATFRERWSLNLRNHRKIVIVDGQVGFTGGMNVGDEYLGNDPHYGYWRDTQLRLHGPCVLQLQQVFAEDWFYATDEKLTHPTLFPDPHETGKAAAQVLASGPENDLEVFQAVFFSAINEAREQVTLATSYFVPPPSLVTALEAAAYRGVHVRLLISGPPTYPWTLLAGRSYYDSLLQSGVEIYEYGKGLFHAKTLTVDGNWSLVGSPNFDMRSFFLNFEVAVAVYGHKIAEALERQFDADLQHARRFEMKEWSRRPVIHMLGENLCRLFSPLL